MRRLLQLLVVCLVFSPALLTAQSVPDESKLNSEIDSLLKNRDVGDLANELHRRKAAGVNEQLKAMVVYARAGHKARVREAIVRLASTSLPEDHSERFRVGRIVRSTFENDDWELMRLCFDLGVPSAIDTSAFIRLWRMNGDVKELEAWLQRQAKVNVIWWDELFNLKASLGTQAELLDRITAELRANPTDEYWLQKYLSATQDSPDFKWLVSLVPPDSSYSSYEFAKVIRSQAPEVAIELLERSLSQQFGSNDRVLFGQRAFRTAAIAPVLKDPEKQLRYWTLSLLARLHTERGRPDLAQPFAERLTAMDTSDIQKDDPFGLAGTVQAASGMRVVESRILQREATDRESAQYWLDRADYYRGRKEPEAAFAAYKQGLDVFPYSTTDKHSERLQMLRGLVGMPSYEEVRTIFRTEIARGNADYRFWVARMFVDRDDVAEEFFVNTNLLPQVLASRAWWRTEEEYLINEAVDSGDWQPAKLLALWKELTRLANANVRDRGYSLAKEFVDRNNYRDAIPLLEQCRKIAPNNYEGGLNFNREDVERMLFDAYIEVGDWRSAKKMYDGGYSYWKDELGKIAATAARAGDIENAIGIWHLNANLDRRKLGGLGDLAETAAKPALREFYLKMKSRDQLSYIPAEALAFLK